MLAIESVDIFFETLYQDYDIISGIAPARTRRIFIDVYIIQITWGTVWLNVSSHDRWEIFSTLKQD